MLDLALPHPGKQNRREQSTLVLTTGCEKLPDLLGRHEPRQRPFGHAEFLDVRHRICEQMILLDRPTEKRKQAPQLIVDGSDRDTCMNRMPTEPSVLRIRFHRSALRIASQF